MKANRTTVDCKKEERSNWLKANLGAILSRCEATLLQGTYERRGRETTDLTHIVVASDELFTFGIRVGARARKVSLLL